MKPIALVLVLCCSYASVAQVAIKGMSQPQRPDEDIMTRFSWLTRDFSHLNSGVDAEVDLSCSTSWCQSNFGSKFVKPTFTPFDGQLVIEPQRQESYESVLSTYSCAHSPDFDIVCRSDVESVKGNGVTHTHTTGFSAGGSVGYAAKIKSQAHEIAVEVTVNGKYDYTSGSSSGTVEGQAAVMAVQVPMLANDARCTVIQVVAGNAKEYGEAIVGVIADGTVALKQDKARHWKYVDPAGSSGLQYRLFTLRDLASRAKQYNLHRTEDMTVDRV